LAEVLMYFNNSLWEKLKDIDQIYSHNVLLNLLEKFVLLLFQFMPEQ